ncbi:MipA/OmpV family protein [Chelativorans sp. AA-79]|uniref:MipA/OmpV family protein n=1 Tax=Chelativorans sp. AA-79 TaxID=3028735 RepID=UPI0023F91FD5|nr:MipA/OmpV family protein [Chelativorans sp. AA-79]WEX11212.1 MipA/OmpV family protein [Chelativorans sp. AA-79]
MSKRLLLTVSGTILLAGFFHAAPVEAQEKRHFWSGDWSLTVGAAGLVAPSFEGSKDWIFKVSPMISLSRQGSATRFSSRNDNPSFGFVDTGVFRAGVVGKLVFKRDGDTDDDLKGLDPIRFGGEVGGFAEIYPTDNIRIRGEVRRGIRSHEGVVADVAVDVFDDLTPTVRVSGGPRLSFASAEYFDAYYGVSAGESARSGLPRYSPGGGVKSVGAGAAVTWKTTDKITTSVFAEYERLLGAAADSPLVERRGSPDQVTLGLSATYRFDFSLD